ncbi:MAG: hypothetical protein ACJAS9_000483 [Polaribacter sp.]|jgi:hypothetical protein
MKNIIICSSAIIISSCASLAIPTLPDESSKNIAPGNGVLALTLNTIEKINHISIESSKAGHNFVIKWPSIGENIFLYEVPAGEYCLNRATYNQGTVYFKDAYSHNSKGFCTIVEEGSLSYSGHIFLRLNPSSINRYQAFVRKLNREYPNTCKEFIGKSCDDY